MVSLGLGLNKSTMDQLKNYGSLTSITVTAQTNGDATKQQKTKYLDDDLIKTIEALPHVKYAAPVLEMNIFAKCGKYSGYLTLEGTTMEAVQDLNIKVGKGTLPQEKAKQLELFYGNMVLTNFNTASGKNYWTDGVLPDIDLMKDSIIYILDADAYSATQGSAGASRTATSETQSVVNPSASSDQADQTEQVKVPKKYLIPVCGVAEGTPNDGHAYSNYVYCDINKLIPIVKREFKNSVIPGQPTTKAGKPFKKLYYSSLNVAADDMNNVNTVNQAIKDLGYDTSNNADWIQSEQKQMNTIQAVLGGIGAVSLLVAAIGITNTMMMSIYERTKEIGIMKVLGCDMHNIQVMFLMEAGFIGLFGGIVGLLLSYGMSVIINMIAGKSQMGITQLSYIPLWLAGLSLVFAVVVGMVSGYFPSRRAMKLSPLAAIHNE
jgi:ABC-type antimicrobial peptide transport system permease subunit